eukprot:32536_1
MSKSFFLGLLCLHCIMSDPFEEDFFFDDFGAWILCRKVVEGRGGNFGLGYSFTVKYELTNIGTQTAHNIKIEDTWDWSYVKRYDQSDAPNIVYTAKELAPQSTTSFTYKLTPTQVGIISPIRANISYAVGEDNEEEYTLINGVSSNWITSNDDALRLRKDTEKSNDNQNNDKLIILTSSQYSRAISSTVFYWIVFVVSCVASVVYPLCEYEANKGDFSFMPFGIGHYLKLVTRLVNLLIVSRIKQQIAQMNKARTKTA